MMRIRWIGVKIVAMVLVALSSMACSTICPRVPKPTATVGEIVDGTYELTMVATRGFQRGTESSGRLTLVQLAEPHWGESRIYGSTNVDLVAIGAPVFDDDEKVPPSTSDDPNAPGVLLTMGRTEGYPPKAPVLLIGTGKNRDPVVGETPDGLIEMRLSVDGAGVGLWVHEVTANGFVGRWSEWGIISNGSGYFCAQLTH